jgi:hypothetical protein
MDEIFKLRVDKICALAVPPTSNVVCGVDKKIPTDVDVSIIVGVELEPTWGVEKKR